MSNFLAFLWLVVSVAFWVTLIIFIVNKIRKKSSKITWKVPTVLFVSGLLLLVGSSMTESNSSNESASSSEKSSKSSSSSNDDYSSSSEESESSEDDSNSDSADDHSEALSALKDSYDANQAEKNTSNLRYGDLVKSSKYHTQSYNINNAQVIQAQEEDGVTNILAYTDDDTDNLFMITVYGNNKIIEDDIINVTGVLGNLKSYDTQSGGNNTVPTLAATNATIIGHSDE